MSRLGLGTHLLDFIVIHCGIKIMVAVSCLCEGVGVMVLIGLIKYDISLSRLFDHHSCCYIALPLVVNKMTHMA